MSSELSSELSFLGIHREWGGCRLSRYGFQCMCFHKHITGRRPSGHWDITFPLPKWMQEFKTQEEKWTPPDTLRSLTSKQKWCRKYDQQLLWGYWPNPYEITWAKLLSNHNNKWCNHAVRSSSLSAPFQLQFVALPPSSIHVTESWLKGGLHSSWFSSFFFFELSPLPRNCCGWWRFGWGLILNCVQTLTPSDLLAC